MFCSALMLIFGILALVKGEFKITSGRMVSGDTSRILGLLLLAGVGGSVLFNNSAVQGLAFVVVVVIGLLRSTPVSKGSEPAAAEQVDSPASLTPKAPPPPDALPAAVAPLVEELISIGQQSKYIAPADGTVFNDRMEHIRARAIGQSLHEAGGLTLMRQAHQHVIAAVHYPGASRELDYCWHRIGQWRA